MAGLGLAHAPAVPDTHREAAEIVRERSRDTMLRLVAWRRLHGRSQTYVAKATGLSVATISQAETGSYEGDVTAIAAKVDAFLETERRRDQSRGNIPFCRTSVAKEVTIAAQHVHEYRVIGAVCGPPGCGKTTALLQGTADNPGQWIYVVMTTATAGPKAMLEEICDRLRLATGGTLRELERRVARHIGDSGRLVVIDEAHYLNDRALLEIQGLHERTNTGILLVGNPTIINRVYGRTEEARFPQLASRVRHVRLLPDEIGRQDVTMIVRAATGEASTELVDFLHKKALGVRGLRGVIDVLAFVKSRVQGRPVEVADLRAAAAFLWSDHE